MKIKRSANLFSLFLSWYFLYIPQKLLERIKNLIRFGGYFFSVSLILKTFFSPWKRLQDYYSGSILDIRRYFETLLGNLISRVIGMVLRFFLLVAFILFEILVTTFGMIILAFWFLAPFLTIIFIYYALFAI
jgi:hypothetical protein